MEIMNTRLKKRLFYFKRDLTGLAKRCDWFINGFQILKLKPIPKTIFLNALFGASSIKCMKRQLINIYSPVVLIVASEDYTFPLGIGDVRKNLYKDCQGDIQLILEHPLVVHVFVENLDILHPKLSPIPLGILKPNQNLLSREYYDTDVSGKDTLCLVLNRSRSGVGQWADRRKADILSRGEWSQFTRTVKGDLGHDEFIQELKRSKFCLCVHGGGYDPCPKFFECILYKTIPIIQHSPLDGVFSKFPVVFIDDLQSSALSEAFLLQKYEELKEWYDGPKRLDILQRLSLDYWWDAIAGTVNSNLEKEVWKTIGFENQTVFAGKGLLRFGIPGKWITVTNEEDFVQIKCQTFGGDPAPRRKKRLQKLEIFA